MSLETYYLTLFGLLLIKINCNGCETTLNLLSICVHCNYVGMLYFQTGELSQVHITFLLSLDYHADNNIKKQRSCSLGHIYIISAFYLVIS